MKPIPAQQRYHVTAMMKYYGDVLKKQLLTEGIDVTKNTGYLPGPAEAGRQQTLPL